MAAEPSAPTRANATLINEQYSYTSIETDQLPFSNIKDGFDIKNAPPVVNKSAIKCAKLISFCMN